MRRRRRGKQIPLKFRTHGGVRAGAGRPRVHERPHVPHRPRAEFAARFPLLVTIRMRRDVANMRNRRCYSALQRAFFAGGDKFGFRLVHYAVMGNHIHMLTEATGKESLSRGMHALNIRIARTLNRVLGRRGAVLDDHYHAQILRSPTQTKRAMNYVRTNARKHYGSQGTDPFVSAQPLLRPHTWLLRRIC